MFFDLASALVEVIPVAVSNLSQVYANLEAFCPFAVGIYPSAWLHGSVVVRAQRLLSLTCASARHLMPMGFLLPSRILRTSSHRIPLQLCSM